METKFKIIETDDYILAVSEEAGEIGCLRIEYMPHKPHCYTRIYNSLNGHTIQLFDKEIWKGEAGFTYKIIAYKSKNNASALDLPLLPEMVVDDDVEKLINEQINDFKHDLVESTSTYYKMNCEGAILALNRLKKSYKAATKVYSEEDLRKAFEAGMYFIGEDKSSYEEFIQSLKQPKTPKWFVAEIEKPKCDCDNTERYVRCIYPNCTKLKTTTINGKTYLVGTYLFE
jgi:hypothetical protein